MAASGNVTVTIEMRQSDGRMLPGLISKYITWVSIICLLPTRMENIIVSIYNDIHMNDYPIVYLEHINFHVSK